MKQYDGLTNRTIFSRHNTIVRKFSGSETQEYGVRIRQKVSDPGGFGSATLSKTSIYYGKPLKKVLIIFVDTGTKLFCLIRIRLAILLRVRILLFMSFWIWILLRSSSEFIVNPALIFYSKIALTFVANFFKIFLSFFK